MSFVFYDTETTGTHTAFDQILQFAAIRTDDNLNPLDQFEIRCRLLPYVIPAPGALRVTGMTIDRLTHTDLCTHYEMVRTIRAKLLEWSPAVFAGYNSIRFDEALLRSAFYQTLHSPYLTNTGGNCRTDVMKLVHQAWLHHPGSIEVPEVDGKPRFKLDALAPANGFVDHAAHDALGDVEATIHMCRVIRERCPQLWVRFVRFANKRDTEQFIAGADAFHLSEFYFNKPYCFVVASLGSDGQGTTLCLDLAADLNELVGMTHEELVAKFRRSPCPIRKVKANAAPNLAALDDVAEEHLKGISKEEVRTRAQRLRDDPDLVQRLLRACTEAKEEYEESPHVEEQLYLGFWSREDEALMNQFHQVPWEERLAIVNAFEDLRLKRLGRRLLFCERPDLLNDETRAGMERLISQRMMGLGEVGAWNTIPGAVDELKAWMTEAPGHEACVGLEAFLREREAWCRQTGAC